MFILHIKATRRRRRDLFRDADAEMMLLTAIVLPQRDRPHVEARRLLRADGEDRASGAPSAEIAHLAPVSEDAKHHPLDIAAPTRSLTLTCQKPDAED
jgi:hypothetical protein